MRLSARPDAKSPNTTYAMRSMQSSQENLLPKRRGRRSAASSSIQRSSGNEHAHARPRIGVDDGVDGCDGDDRTLAGTGAWNTDIHRDDCSAPVFELCDVPSAR